jgi:hypothetical protein
VEVLEVGRLDEHVAELGERQPALESHLDRILREHVRDREVLAHVAQEVEQRDRLQPAQVVLHARGVRPVEVEEVLELESHRRRVRLDHVRGLQVALAGPAGRIADHPGAAAHERDRAPAVALEVDQPEDRHEVADVQPRAGGIEAVVGGDLALGGEPGLEAIRRGVKHPAPAELGQEAGRTWFERGRHRSTIDVT